MNRELGVSDLTGFSPCQYVMAISEPLKKVDETPSSLFDVQEKNIKHIFSNNLDKRQSMAMEGMPLIPDDIQKKMYSNIAQRQFDKELLDIKQDKDFSVDMDEIPETQKNASLKLF